MVKHFSGANIKEMESYINPTLQQNQETIINQPESNDLKCDSSSEEIARYIVNLTTPFKIQTNKLILSRIVPRYDNLN